MTDWVEVRGGGAEMARGREGGRSRWERRGGRGKQLFRAPFGRTFTTFQNGRNLVPFLPFLAFDALLVFALLAFLAFLTFLALFAFASHISAGEALALAFPCIRALPLPAEEGGL